MNEVDVPLYCVSALRERGLQPSCPVPIENNRCLVAGELECLLVMERSLGADEGYGCHWPVIS